MPAPLTIRKPDGRGNGAMPALDPLEIFMQPQVPEAELMDNGIASQENADGSITFDLNPGANRKPKSSRFDANLAEDMDDSELSTIANDLDQGVQRDIQTRSEWMQDYASGLTLLGLKVESEKGDAGQSTAPLEGMSRVRHPGMLEACLLFQAVARGELLPAAGPVKVRDDSPDEPEVEEPVAPPPMNGAGGAPPNPEGPQPAALPGPMGMPPSPQATSPGPDAMNGLGGAPAMPAWAAGMMGSSALSTPSFTRDELANALEKDFNHYLTVTASEYYPDTDQMNFNAGFCGIGIKKVYNCPLRRRPVSETINIEDFIVSANTTSLAAAGRHTHRIKMRPSTMKRMQILGAYRDIKLQVPNMTATADPVEQAKANVQGIQTNNTDPRDNDYVLYEVYCELDLDQFAPKKFKGKGLPLPYIVTLETESKQVLQVRRNWREKDEQAQAKEYFVDYVFDRAFGFYGIGYLHILGNTTRTLTAAWRELIDSGMFANFPGFLYAKGLNRQMTNQFRIPPGGGMGLDIGLADIRNAIMPLPYKDLGPAFVQFITHVEEMSSRLGGTAMTNVAEGRQDAPVGTTLALIEQASKPTGAVMKRFHAAQAKEFQLLKERFQEDPEAFWRFNNKPQLQWRKELFLQALNDFDLVPVSDPNNPTRLHRAAKGSVVQQLAMAAPMAFDIPEAIKYIGRQNEIPEIEDLLAKGPPPGPAEAPVDAAKMAEINMKGGAAIAKTAVDLAKVQHMAKTAEAEQAQQMAEAASRERIAMINYNTEMMRLASSMAIHSDTIDQADRGTMNEILKSAHEAMQKHSLEQVQRQHDRDLAIQEQAHQRGLKEAEHESKLQIAKIPRSVNVE